MPKPSEISAPIVDTLIGAESEFRAIESQLEGVALNYIRDALSSLCSGEWEVGDKFSHAALLENVVDSQRQLVLRLLGHLEDHGEIVSSDDGWEVAKARVLPPEPGEATSPEDELLRQAGPVLGDILRGAVSPLGSILSDSNFSVTADFYSEGHLFRRFNQIAAQIVRQIVKRSANTHLRVIEVGAGTGGLTRHLLPEMRAHRSTYYFTDVTKHFTRKAEGQFSEFEFLKYDLLDITRPSSTQGMEPGSFDLVVAANVVHATPNVRESLRNLHELLSPGGLLLLFEVTTPQVWGDVIFGTTEGWWSFADHDLRSESR